MTLIIDAAGCRLGRMATHVAKAALHGETVVVVNCEEAIITGKKSMIYEKYAHIRQLGRPTKGPFLPRMPDRFVRRVIRSMLPYKSPHGAVAFARVMCYTGVPAEFEGKPTVQFERKPSVRFMNVKELCNLIGGKQ